MRYLAVFVAVAVLYSTLAAAQITYFNFGEGQAGCGEFLQAAEAERKERPPTARPTQLYNRSYTTAWDTTHSELGKETDTQGRMAWMENYCRGKPLDKLSNAVIGLRMYLLGEAR